MPIPILVTGGAGYVGSHACKALAAAGYEPVTFDDLSRGHQSAVRWGPLVKGTLADGDALHRTLVEHGCQAVMHFAALAYVGESMTHPGAYFRNNVTGTLNMLDAMHQADVRRLVFSSTCATYGDPLNLPIGETHPQNPVNPYGESKLFVEKAIRWYEQIHGLQFVLLRYFNAAGSDFDTEIGECHDPETHVIPLAIQAALGQRENVSIFGTDYETPDGTAIRDYVHVTDLAEAHVMALHHLEQAGACLAVNLGTGNGHSVREIITAVQQASSRTVPVIESPRRAGDPPILVADPTLAREVLGWQPRHSTLNNIVDTALRWATRSQ